MAEKFLMPKLSPTMEEGQIARWVKNEGDSYEANETLAEVDTDKATMEMTALTAGTLLKILKGAGETAALGEAIAIIGNKGDDIADLIKETSSNGSAKPAAEASVAVEKSVGLLNRKPVGLYVFSSRSWRVWCWPFSFDDPCFFQSVNVFGFW